MKNMRSVYLEDKKYFEIEPNPILVNDMRERGIIPADISDDEICIVIWGAGSWQMCWRDEDTAYTYNPWADIVTERKIEE